MFWEVHLKLSRPCHFNLNFCSNSNNFYKWRTIYVVHSLCNDFKHLIDIFKDCVTVWHSVPLAYARLTQRRCHRNAADVDATVTIIIIVPSSPLCHNNTDKTIILFTHWTNGHVFPVHMITQSHSTTLFSILLIQKLRLQDTDVIIS